MCTTMCVCLSVSVCVCLCVLVYTGAQNQSKAKQSKAISVIERRCLYIAALRIMKRNSIVCNALHRLRSRDVSYVHPAVLSVFGIYNKDKVFVMKPFPSMVERRFARDGRLYTQEEFVAWYGRRGWNEWHRARDIELRGEQ